MKTAIIKRVSRDVRSPLCIFAAFIFILCATRSASATWRAVDAQNAFTDYNSAFYFNPSGSNYDYRVDQGSTTPTSFWMAAEQIEMAVDAYEENKTTSNKTIITQLIDGFNTLHPNWWTGSSDSYDDDLNWATIAFVRAYQAVGTSVWLTDAEDGFNTVHSRGLASNGGIYWNSACESSCSSWYENSPANWTFVIAGHLIYNNNGNTGSYKSEADSVFSWAYANLYNSSTGQIYDGYKSSGQIVGDYSYNYGTAIGAASEHGGESTVITNVANYLMNDMSSYEGNVGGYNILLDYDSTETGKDGGGFNGIAMRWIGVANAHGSISSAVLAWAQANINQAWAVRYSSGLSWDDWMTSTPSSGLYSWDCSSTLVGMLDLPPTS